MFKRLKSHRRKSIFTKLFVPLIFVMILQAVFYYFSAFYGGISDSLNQNASDILTERASNRRNELDSSFNDQWHNLTACEEHLDKLYNSYQLRYGDTPFADSTDNQVAYLENSFDYLVNQLRANQTNGIFLILNDKTSKTSFPTNSSESKYGIFLRDMDSTSTYTGREDLLLERIPSSLVEQTDCSLDSWWTALYTFDSPESGSYYYEPLNAAWDNPGTDSEDVAYFEGIHRLSSSDQEVVSYSIPLLDKNGSPYAVLGVELTQKYLSSILPNTELGSNDKTCYILASHKKNSTECTPLAANGALYNRCFHNGMIVSCGEKAQTGGFTMTGQDGTELYGTMTQLNIYNNNNPFEDDELVLVALEESDTLFYYSHNVKKLLLFSSIISLIIGTACIFIVSRHFAKPIMTLAKRARNVEPQKDFHLDHLGIVEIDQLVDSIENLELGMSKETARTEFFSRMSHDMRTPMNAIISFSSPEMLDGTDEKQKNDYLEKIHTSGEFLLGLINEVLDITKIDSRKVDLNFDSVCANEMMDAIVPMIDKLADEKNICFEKIIDIPPETYIKADEQHINQILLNLLSNSVKFTEENGKVTMECKMIKENDGRIHSLFVVSDNGIGMSREFMKKLYQPFEQEREGHGGTGLGLSISKKLTELMGGAITCSSEKNLGTKFTVELYFESDLPPTDTLEIRIQNDIQTDMDILKGKRILICEDQPLNVMIAKRILERAGMLAEVAQNGQEGADKFAEMPENYFDAVLMDIRMPVLDGLGATRKIRSLDRNDAKTIPIVAMTANAFEEDMKMSREAGMNAHLSKPIDTKMLYNTLAEFLSKK